MSAGSNRRGVRILIVDDEPSFREGLSSALRDEGFAVDIAGDGHEALQRFEATEPHLVLLDVMLPGISGVDVCRELRQRSSTVGIIMVTARSSELDTVVGLEVGADDYVVKPFRVRELLARIRVQLRRLESMAANAQERAIVGERPHDVIEIGSIRLDPARPEVTVDGIPVHLPLKEFELLEVLMLNAGRVVTRDALIDRVWGGDYVGDTKTLDVHVKRIRSKIENDPNDPQRVITVRGVGYRFERV